MSRSAAVLPPRHASERSPRVPWSPGTSSGPSSASFSCWPTFYVTTSRFSLYERLVVLYLCLKTYIGVSDLLRIALVYVLWCQLICENWDVCYIIERLKDQELILMKRSTWVDVETGGRLGCNGEIFWSECAECDCSYCNPNYVCVCSDKVQQTLFIHTALCMPAI